MTVVIANGARTISDWQMLADQRGLHRSPGSVASTPMIWRVLNSSDTQMLAQHVRGHAEARAGQRDDQQREGRELTSPTGLSPSGRSTGAGCRSSLRRTGHGSAAAGIIPSCLRSRESLSGTCAVDRIAMLVRWGAAGPRQLVGSSRRDDVADRTGVARRWVEVPGLLSQRPDIVSAGR